LQSYRYLFFQFKLLKPFKHLQSITMGNMHELKQLPEQFLQRAALGMIWLCPEVGIRV
jgi:hypothetical protein